MDSVQLTAYLAELNPVSIFLRLLLATLCGGLIGMERGEKRRAAGVRTHILVCLGSSVTMITNQYLFTVVSNGAGDPGRLGAQVISGIGFLGAGTIIVTGRQQIKGLTTAAGLWASACMGLAIGAGFYLAAVIAFGFIFVVVTMLGSLDDYFYSRSRTISLYIELKNTFYFKDLISYLKESHRKIDSIDVEKGQDPGHGHDILGIFLILRLPKGRNESGVLAEIRTLPGVSFAEELE